MALAEFYLAQAADVAKRGDCRRAYWLGAVAVRADGAVVKAYNGLATTKTGSVHAECRVLRKAGYGCTVYVARIGGDGNWALAKPCRMCQRLLRLKEAKVYWTVAPGEYAGNSDPRTNTA